MVHVEKEGMFITAAVETVPSIKGRHFVRYERQNGSSVWLDVDTKLVYASLERDGADLLVKEKNLKKDNLDIWFEVVGGEKYFNVYYLVDQLFLLGNPEAAKTFRKFADDLVKHFEKYFAKRVSEIHAMDDAVSKTVAGA